MPIDDTLKTVQSPLDERTSQIIEDLGILRLSVAERLELIGAIWDSLPDTTEALPIPEWHREELERRLADCEVHPEEAIPWEEVKASLRRQK